MYVYMYVCVFVCTYVYDVLSSSPTPPSTHCVRKNPVVCWKNPDAQCCSSEIGFFVILKTSALVRASTCKDIRYKNDGYNIEQGLLISPLSLQPLGVATWSAFSLETRHQVRLLDRL